MPKKYYWLKLKETFFNQKEIKLLRRLAGGDTFTIIYLKLLLLSLKSEGYIYFEDIGDDFVDELVLEIDEDKDNIKMTLSYLFSKGLIETFDEKEYYLNGIPEMIGSESESTRRVRKFRKRKKQEALQCNGDETNSNTEKETEKETEIDREREQQRTSEIIHFWDNNGFGSNNIQAKKQLLLWLDDSSFKNSEKIILKAMEIACANNKRQLNYIEGILRNWQNESLLTLEEIKDSNKEHKKQTAANDGYNYGF
ncbi:phage replisome organizer N-terminal domain-containing protein [Virgibacillus ihumii]|uniref:phage replisome organizer N-terminal domain-containing protein n=1 Tax=Virgibacillus ihumii TaxID=2686091 RepID=UPI00157BB9C5|nr:phage replisome organizer N-terminal domain-containing protein [Virgibacillus ihumii]